MFSIKIESKNIYIDIINNNMNLSQRKLNKSEWNSVEIPVSLQEKNVINMIVQGYHDLNYTFNETLSLMGYLKIEYSEVNENYIYSVYLEDKIKKINKKYEIDYNNRVSIDRKKINKINIMRIDNNSKDILKKETDDIYEFKLLDFVSKLLKYKHSSNYKWCVYFYTLCRLIKYDIYNVNKQCIHFIKYILDLYMNEVEITAIIAKGKEFIECNENLLKYAPNKLYTHQKDIFTIFRKTEVRRSSNLVLYMAPTATGKTLTPIALSENHRIIFVCAARHVGVALAKSAISVGKKIAFAFGCDTADDIRLHYYAAKTYEKHRRTGGIFKVDNSDGINVEIMICDIKSYLCAMRYMMSFNDELNQTNNDMIMFWDEPTITLDYESHECHEYISKNWQENEIPNIVLSSATLPDEIEIGDTISGFKMNFENSIIHKISSSECKKSIQLTNTSGEVILPHLVYKNYDDLQKCIHHCIHNRTIFRYLDLHYICIFIVLLNEDDKYTIIPELQIRDYFESIYDIDMESIKEYYFKLLQSIPVDSWDYIYTKFKTMNNIAIEKNKYYKDISNGMNITTCDAFTLTDGPTIFIADNVEKIAKYCIQQSKIPQHEISKINNDIQFNNKINHEIIKITKTLEDIIQKDIDAGNEKKLQKDSPETKQLRNKLNELNKIYKEISIDKIYVPNSLSHLHKWCDESIKNGFSSNITNIDVQRIMELPNIEDIWKLLLLMGIGLFSKDKPIEYTEIVKEFADNQKLYLIIANGDYIYGTNYQFCHAFIGRDLSNITQEKIIQAMGRVGRNKLQQTYSIRLRNDDLVNKILVKEENKIEVYNMNKLFTCGE
jgi:hypothetical protein